MTWKDSTAAEPQITADPHEAAPSPIEDPEALPAATPVADAQITSDSREAAPSPIENPETIAAEADTQITADSHETVASPISADPNDVVSVSSLIEGSASTSADTQMNAADLGPHANGSAPSEHLSAVAPPKVSLRAGYSLRVTDPFIHSRVSSLC